MAKVEYVAALDAGSSNTRYLVGAVEDARLRLLGAGQAKSEGWHRGRIADQQAVIQSMGRAIQEGEQAAGVSPPTAVLGIGGNGIEGLENRGLYEMGRPRVIEPGDTRYAVERAIDVSMPADRILLQTAPQSFCVDGKTNYWNPQGIRASRLESFVHLVTASRLEHDCLIAAAHQAHLAVEETVFEPYAAAYAAVTPEERRAGVAVVDIGAQSTGIVVFVGDALVVSASLPIGGDHFTRDAAHGLCISLEDAERLKVEWGCAMIGLTADNSIIEIPSPDGRPPREAPRLELNRILEPRAGELFLRVRNEVSKAGMDQGHLGLTVLSGGGALMNGMWGMAERVLNCQARLGLADSILDWPADMRSPAWTTAAGLLMYAARLRCQESEPERPGFWGRLFG